jgi:uncharacterized membrane protein (DUF106 family)
MSQINHAEQIKFLLKDDKNIPILEEYLKVHTIDINIYNEIIKNITIYEDKLSKIEVRFYELTSNITNVNKNKINNELEKLEEKNEKLEADFYEMKVYAEDQKKLYQEYQDTFNNFLQENASNINYDHMRKLLSLFKYQIYVQTFDKLLQFHNHKLFTDLTLQNPDSVLNAFISWIYNISYDKYSLSELVKFLDFNKFGPMYYKKLADFYLKERYYHYSYKNEVFVVKSVFLAKNIESEFIKTFDINFAKYLIKIHKSN